MTKNNKQSGHGFLPDIVTGEDYIFGGYTKLPQEMLQPDGDWSEFLPETELQYRNGLETMNCTVYGTLNVIETLFKRLFKQEINKSERYIGVLSKTSPAGNSPQKVIETIRKEVGLIDEKLLPFDETIDTWGKYYSPNPMTKNYLKEGQKWLEKFNVGHEWVFISPGKNNQKKIKEALKYSPLGVSVCLNEQENGIYKRSEGDEDNHWVMLFGYLEGQYWKIFDHYDDVFKKMAWDYDFNLAKKYYLKKNENFKKSIWEKIKEFIKNILKL